MPENLSPEQENLSPEQETFLNLDGTDISRLVKKEATQNDVDKYNCLTAEFRKAQEEGQDNLLTLSKERRKHWDDNLSKL